MNKTIPLEKRSKRDRRAYYNDKRNDWNGVTPVTRVIPGKKGYDRNRQRSADRRSLVTEGLMCRRVDEEGKRQRPV